MKEFDAMGREIPDLTPVPAPPGARGDDLVSRHLQLKAFIRRELSRAADEDGYETFEEADDFDVDEDPDPLSAYEMQEGLPEWPQGVKDVDPDGPGAKDEVADVPGEAVSAGRDGEAPAEAPADRPGDRGGSQGLAPAGAKPSGLAPPKSRVRG